MTSDAVLDYTANLHLALPTFDLHLWHTYINDDFKILDAVIGHYLAINHIVGIWQNSTLYHVGDRVIDGDSGAIFECMVEHTSAAKPTTFAQDRSAHPTYWRGALPSQRFRGAWQNSTAYDANDFVVSGTKYAVCTASHTSIAVPGHFEDDSAYWVVLIDLTTIGTVGIGPGPDGSACLVLTNSTPQAWEVCSQSPSNNFAITDVTHGGDRLTINSLTGVANFGNTPTAPTATVGDNSTKLATTAFVQSAVVSGVAAGVSSFNGRAGVVVLTSADITGAGGALAANTVISFNTRQGVVTLLAADIIGVTGIGTQFQMARFGATGAIVAENAPYDLCFSTDDAALYSNGYVIVRHLPVHPFILKAGLSGSRGGCVVAPTGSIAVAIKKNGTGVGTINIAAAATTATFTLASDASFTTSDTLTLTAPVTADATLAGVFASLLGIRQ